MIDPALEKKLDECKKIREFWRQFRDFFNLAVAKQQPITHEKELEFLKIKSNLAILHDAYLEAIHSNPKTAQNVMIIVSRSITLKHVAELSIAETKKFEIEWHESFLQMEETISLLEEERKRLAPVTESEHWRRSQKAKFQRRTTAVVGNPLFKLAIIIVVIVIAFVFMIIFNVAQKLYDNPKTQAIGVMLRGAQRFFNSDYPFADLKIEEVVPAKLPGNKPGGWQEVRLISAQDCPKEKAIDASKMIWEDGSALNVTDDLGRSKQYAVIEVTFQQAQRSNHLKLFYFLMNDVPEARSVLSKYKEFKDKQPSNQPGNCNDYRLFYRKANVVVIVCSNRSEMVMRAAETFWYESKLEALPQTKSQQSPAYN